MSDTPTVSVERLVEAHNHADFLRQELKRIRHEIDEILFQDDQRYVDISDEAKARRDALPAYNETARKNGRSI